MIKRAFGCLVLITLLISFTGCIKSVYKPLTQKQVDKFIKKKDITPLDIKNIGNYTVILYETSDEEGRYALSSNQYGKLREGQGLGDKSYTTPVSIGGGMHYSRGVGRIEFLTIIIDDDKILKEAYKIKLLYGNSEVIELLNNRKGMIIPCPLDCNKELYILDKSDKIMYSDNMYL